MEILDTLDLQLSLFPRASCARVPCGPRSSQHHIHGVGQIQIETRVLLLD